MTPEKLLAVWQEHHGSMPPRWRSVFIADARVEWLTTQSHLLVVEAVRQHRKLDDAVNHVQRQTRLGRPRSSTGHASRSGSAGFYRMPRPRKSEAPAGVCPACGVTYGYDGRCNC